MIQLTEVARLPDIYTAYWRTPDGAVLRTTMSSEEYRGLAVPQRKEPPRSRSLPREAVWWYAAQENFYRTTSGLLEFGQYADEWEAARGRFIRINLGDGVVIALASEHLIDKTGGLSLLPNPEGVSIVAGTAEITDRAAFLRRWG